MPLTPLATLMDVVVEQPNTVVMANIASGVPELEGDRVNDGELEGERVACTESQSRMVVGNYRHWHAVV